MTQRLFALARLSLADDRPHQIYLGLRPFDQQVHAVSAQA